VPRKFTLAVAQQVWQELCGALEEEAETAAVLLAGVADVEDRPAFLVNQVMWVPQSEYLERGPSGLRISSQGWVPALKRAADARLHPIFFHTHPGERPSPSTYDHRVDEALQGPFRIRTDMDLYASLILGGVADAPSFTGRVLNETGLEMPISRIRIVGTRLEILPAFDDETAYEADRLIHDRQIRAFGGAGQRKLADLKIGLVGAGGTGSAVAEQLTRLGVRELVVIDDDRITPTNVSRVYGSTTRDEGVAKVEVARNNAARIGLGTHVEVVEGRVHSRRALEALRGCDVVFGCTDDHLGRFNLSRFAFYYLVPIIDVGVVIDASENGIRSITGRITYVAPGEACLLCRGVVDTNRVREESYEPDERERLAGEGYAQGLGEPDPSVIAYTTMVGSWGVADLLERLFGFGSADVRGELLLRIADRKMTSRTALPDPEHICGQPRRWGLGDQAEFLGQMIWPS
jgi:hypothetical protein